MTTYNRWPPSYLAAIIAAYPNRDAARILGVRHQSVSSWRQRLGIGDPTARAATCTACRRTLLIAAFDPRWDTPTGFDGACRPCRAIADRALARAEAANSRTGMAQRAAGRARGVRLAEEWRDDAACVGAGDVFFPAAGPEVEAEAEAARAVCAGCPVRRQCGEWADRHGIQHGVWGGRDLEETTRRRNRTRRPAAA